MSTLRTNTLQNLDNSFNQPLTNLMLKSAITDGSIMNGLTYTPTGATTPITVLSKLNGTVSVSDFGAVGDGVTNDTPAFQAALNSLGGKGGVVNVPKGKKYLIDTALTIPVNAVLRGPYVFVGSPGNNASTPYGNMGCLIVNPSVSITCQSSAGLEGLFIQRKGMTFPTVNASAFAGQAIVGAGDDVFVRSCFIVGFAKAFYTTGCQRTLLEDILFDCNNGLHIDNALDVPKLRSCHGWPFTTIQAVTAGTSGASLTRSGNAFWLSTAADWATVHGCFSYGYACGFLLDGVNIVSLVQCGADNTTTYAGSVGFKFINGCTDTTMSACQVAAQTTGIYLNHVTVANLHTKITGCDVFGNSSNGILVDGGDVTITNTNIRNGANGISVNNVNSKVSISSCRFNTISDSPINLFVANPYVKILDNTYGDLGTGVSPSKYNNSIPSIAAAAQLNLQPNQDLYTITSGPGINTIAGGFQGRRIVLKFNASVAVSNGNAGTGPGGAGLRLSGSATFNAVGGSTLQLIFDGGYWYEVSRSS